MKIHSKRKRKSNSALSSIDTTGGVETNTNKMDDNPSEFIDYLASATNISGIDEESMLLSPILNESQNITVTAGSTVTKRRRSARLRNKNREMLMNSMRSEKTTPGTMSKIELNTSIPEHEVLHFESQKTFNIFSPQAVDTVAKKSEMKVNFEEGDGGNKAQAPGLAGLLDTSACPSLGLGSIETNSSSKNDLSQGSDEHLNVSDGRNASGNLSNDSGLSFDSSLSRSLDGSESSLQASFQSDDSRKSSHDDSLNSNVKQEMSSDFEQNIRPQDTHGPLFKNDADAAITESKDDEAVDASLQTYIQSDDGEKRQMSQESSCEYKPSEDIEQDMPSPVDIDQAQSRVKQSSSWKSQDDIAISECNDRKENYQSVPLPKEVCSSGGETYDMQQDICNDIDKDPRPQPTQNSFEKNVVTENVDSRDGHLSGDLSPDKVFKNANNVTQSPTEPVQQSSRTPQSATHEDDPMEKSTPIENDVRTTSSMEAYQTSLTPSKSIDIIRNGLTPRLKALRSKIIRESTGDRSEEEIDFSSSLLAEDSQILNKQTPPHEIEKGSESTLTPALKSLRSKLYDESPGQDKIAVLRNQVLTSAGNLGGPSEVESSIQNAEALTPSHQAGMVEESNYTEETKTPAESTDANRLSLTPALKAFRMKLMNSTLSPLDNTPASQGSTSSINGQQFLSPILRPSTSSLGTSGESRGTRRVVFEEDDSYLRQPDDLSSAKKNLNAQSSALVERLRGAAHMRMISIARSRDSLAAKESLHFGKHDEEGGNQEANNSDVEASLREKTDMSKHTLKQGLAKSSHERMKRTDTNTKARGRKGISTINNKSITVAISPKLGSRRKKSIMTSVAKEGMKPKVKTRSKNQGLPKVKRRSGTIPKSPLLGSRRNIQNKVLNKKEIMRHEDESAKGEYDKLSPLAHSIRSKSPVGLTFLKKVPIKREHGDENVAPFTLHSSMRAKERAHFEFRRAANESLRNEETKRNRERILREKNHELGRLRDKLR